ncbi:efflux RND transporter periplasmic adaptor subunit [Vibrio neptunius]|uniref:Efflux RND transporter periplasmic adaptor subunit n=1 Tax=Vibrio neptunius TaxID=170651 RepID=A0ABS2ZXZ9_9VIBR|nr:efflux RND transporter periplasmic adaptor subunit [Vibrio neptunius]MBN3492517.1 efflux RND transporter periplasmic adaptor subunit [Vibrio neptunius]MBN3515014.1 efflux RND transporter periplasmic adaptor subunit [Vibrio neptunius]MBN3548726.1 efflux RND transporter periplasmic adaptor subunit [Vibrio neptunius]MBN3577142.1 efflux RND transporter periplasmic adaptor subunit [Vibrio neptunius]MCH9870807.1 efflux RND transporter periplasmic adaptor subunit [Vibrio neptunius]
MKFKKTLAILAGCGAIFAALVVVDVLEPQPVVIEQKAPIKAPISVLQVTPEAHESSLTLLATTTARWPLQLKASSSAQLAWLNPDIEPGVLVKKGTLLAKLNTSALESNLAQANSSVKQAELNLKQAQHEQTVALKMLSPTKSSPFARREPQVLAAKAELAQAKQAYTSAAKLLEEASIAAPFDAVIMRRNISPGEWLEAGQVTFELAASDSLDVELPVSEIHWQQVQSALRQPEITIVNRDGSEWQAQVRYVSPQADPTTRQRQVVLSVREPYQGMTRLLPNQQVKVIVSLGLRPEIVTLPLSAITRDGYVWTLDEQNRLQKEWITQVGQARNQVYARFVQDSAKARQVVVYPLLSMLPGKQVAPQAAQILVAKQEGNQ